MENNITINVISGTITCSYLESNNRRRLAVNYCTTNIWTGSNVLSKVASHSLLLVDNDVTCGKKCHHFVLDPSVSEGGTINL